MEEQKFLIVVDMQKDFIDGALGTQEAQAMVSAAAARITECKAAGYTLIATLDTHEENYMETREGKHLPVPHCIRGTAGWRIRPEIMDALGDDAILVEKPTFGRDYSGKERGRRTRRDRTAGPVHGHLRGLQRAAAESGVPGNRLRRACGLLRGRYPRKARSRPGNHAELPDHRDLRRSIRAVDRWESTEYRLFSFHNSAVPYWTTK